MPLKSAHVDWCSNAPYSSVGESTTARRGTTFPNAQEQPRRRRTCFRLGCFGNAAVAPPRANVVCSLGCAPVPSYTVSTSYNHNMRTMRDLTLSVVQLSGAHNYCILRNARNNQPVTASTKTARHNSDSIDSLRVHFVCYSYHCVNYYPIKHTIWLLRWILLKIGSENSRLIFGTKSTTMLLTTITGSQQFGVTTVKSVVQVVNRSQLFQHQPLRHVSRFQNKKPTTLVAIL